MNHLKLLLAIIFGICLLQACLGNNSAYAAKKDAANKNVSGSSAADASFSCKIDGRDFSENKNDNLANAAFKTSPGIISFALVKIDKSQKGIPEQFKFVVADHGTTTMHNSNSTDNDNYSASYGPRDYNDAFGFKELTVTVTSSDASGIKGTFSGTLIDPRGDKKISVTDGKFDLPWSPYSTK